MYQEKSPLISLCPIPSKENRAHLQNNHRQISLLMMEEHFVRSTSPLDIDQRSTSLCFTDKRVRCTHNLYRATLDKQIFSSADFRLYSTINKTKMNSLLKSSSVIC